MTLIIEDGSIVDNANSYVTLAESRAYALERGITLPTDDAELEALLILGMDYLESKRAQYQGYKVSGNQSLQWPRYYVQIDGFDFASDEIPQELKDAEMQLAIDENAGITLQPSTSENFVKKEKIDVIEIEYSEKLRTSVSPDLTAVDALLEPLFSPTGSSFALTSVRI